MNSAERIIISCAFAHFLLLLLARPVLNKQYLGIRGGKRASKGPQAVVLFISFHPANPSLLRPPGITKTRGWAFTALPACTIPAPKFTHRYGIIVGRQFSGNCKAVGDGRIQGVLKVKRTVVLSYKGVYNLFLTRLSVP